MQDQKAVMRGLLPTAALCLVFAALIGASGSRYVLHRDDLGAVLHDVRATLYATPVRVYYTDFCSGSKDNPLNFPASQMYDFVTPRSGRRGIGAMREMLRANASGAIVSVGPKGVPRVRVGTVSAPILRTRLRLLRLTALEQYNPSLAILAIQKTKAVTSAMQQRGLHFPLEIMGVIVQQPRQGLPHLPPVISDATVDEALDLVAVTFRGVVVYDECIEPRGGGGYLSLGFIGLE